DLLRARVLAREEDVFIEWHGMPFPLRAMWPRAMWPRAMCPPRRVALRALSGKARMLRRRKHRTPGHLALPPAFSNRKIWRESPRPSVQLPAGIERKPRLIGPSGQKARFAGAGEWVSLTFGMV